MEIQKIHMGKGIYRRGNCMLEIKNDCTLIQKYIKKSESTLEVFMYSPAGITFIIMIPFVIVHKKYLNKVQEYVNILNDYSKKYNLDVKFDEFCEKENYAVIYNQSQLSSLTIKQHEWKLDYLHSLNDRVQALKDCI